MKTAILTLVFSMAFSATGLGQSQYTEGDLLGVWELRSFYIEDENGVREDWCNGAHGSIAYLPGLMTVSINCESTKPGSAAEELGGLLFYSGPFEVDTKKGEVIHRVRNSSHESLNKVFRRKISMYDYLYLKLEGSLGEGKKVVVDWDRKETFSYSSLPVAGVYELVGSENEVYGSDEKIPFCTGFYGTIAYTPGGYTAVSINCGEKADSNVSEPADQFGRKYFYAGNYVVNGDEVVQTPVNASVVEQIGKPGVRHMSFDKDVLILEGTNGSKFKAKWRKLKSFVGLESLN